MKKPNIKVVIGVVILIIVVGLIWIFWGGEQIREYQKQQEIRSRVFEREVAGYTKEEAKTEEGGGAAVSFKPSEESEENVQRVVDNVTVHVVEYETPAQAQKQIEDAGLVYIWEWRKEKIEGQEVSTGYLFNPQERRYDEAYLAWIEDDTIYYELKAAPSDIRDFSDKEFLYRSAKEVAESILGGTQ